MFCRRPHNPRVRRQSRCRHRTDACVGGRFRDLPREGEPYLGRTGNLRRRLARLLRVREQPGRLLYLRGISERIEYWPAASRLESSLVLYEAAKQSLPSRYTQFLKLRMPPYVRLTLNRTFPGTQVTTRPAAGVIYGTVSQPRRR